MQRISAGVGKRWIFVIEWHCSTDHASALFFCASRVALSATDSNARSGFKSPTGVATMYGYISKTATSLLLCFRNVSKLSAPIKHENGIIGVEKFRSASATSPYRSYVPAGGSSMICTRYNAGCDTIGVNVLSKN